MNHSTGDGSSFWQFFNSLSEIFMGSQEETIDNNNNNKLLCLKNPPIFREVSGPICSLPLVAPDESTSLSETPVVKERIFHFSSEILMFLKSKANQDCGTTNISSFQSVTAFIWRSITRARKLGNDQETTCRLAAGNRSRMNPPLPMGHFGLYISPVQATMKTGSLLENEFGWAALKLHQAVTEHTDEKVSSEIDRWLKSFLKFGGLFSPNLVHVGGSPRFNMYGCEFGMGKAVAVRTGYGCKFDGKVTAYPGREGGGSMDLEVCLPPEFMEALESDQEFMSLVSSYS
ncbi:PREDICTED: uncharacterized acetyltransferase At3g50280-like [Camelina sativa]|uniref:Uncharacterized acetyltransferase At3g50280-like n=1 Tax=Camelina sativa TaxID=90675 RepID=A0ABM1RE67_CAMSA|nr:PREDICTED: uncharacterized acetyltransferase At3g50280-like [Camelina sativa]